MKIKTITNETDYNEALRAIDRLMGAASGTPEGGELEVLATLVEAYEAERWPVEPPDPDAELMRQAQAGEVRLGRPNDAALYTRPPQEERWPHEKSWRCWTRFAATGDASALRASRLKWTTPP
ncbi:MAG: hypothetical protein OXI49_13090 [Acidobacteriota bacterium]|nr:hypothetical protein [Acidobacteriota bacterium]